MSTFLTMGGYGAYIWAAYGVAVLGLAGLVGVSLASRKRARREVLARGLGKKR